MTENGAFTAAITTKKMKKPSAILRCRAFAGIAVIEVARSSRDPARWSPIEVFCNMSYLGAVLTRAVGPEMRTVHRQSFLEAEISIRARRVGLLFSEWWRANSRRGGQS